jgi:hypothetical protein
MERFSKVDKDPFRLNLWYILRETCPICSSIYKVAIYTKSRHTKLFSASPLLVMYSASL